MKTIEEKREANKKAVMKYYFKNKEELIRKRRPYLKSYFRKNLLRTGGKLVRGIKRDYPLENKCELCGLIKKHLAYHHWDNNDLTKGAIKGIWVCLPCHHFIDFIEKNTNWFELSDKYSSFKKTIL